MIKMVAADMDGTSLGPNEAISEKNSETVKKVLESGREFLFASGRPTFGMLGLIKKAGLDDKVRYFIAYNGGVVHDIKEGKNLYVKKLDFSIIKGVYDIVMDNKIDISFCIHEKNFIFITQDNKELEVEVSSNHQTKVFIKDINDYKDIDFMKILLVGKRENLDIAVAKLKESNVSDDINLMFSLDFLLEVVPKGSDKSVALKWFSDYSGIPLTEVLSIGDGENDIEMLKESGYSAAMSNAYDHVKESADYVTENDNNADGLTEAVEHFIKF
ncbi:Cof-type HAD-IIB family hydrolase [Sebaldella sp. S0638]|uniref:Cof-type HAD-IIB family hydrolase n=1 Tax=Sebaldella sp. S0638 TaxID=2957809 RepID=UPI00209FDBEB|nr:Cof-type HAD-IIB family hydrolase [Sebaldella sp. S0638]MCP1223523.1 Cof-type HAD-IIB family hydrolase [Sebaldella sp. S0638]